MTGKVWPLTEDVERYCVAAEAGTLTPIQLARLCACARNAARQRDELFKVLSESTGNQRTAFDAVMRAMETYAAELADPRTAAAPNKS